MYMYCETVIFPGKLEKKCEQDKFHAQLSFEYEKKFYKGMAIEIGCELKRALETVFGIAI